MLPVVAIDDGQAIDYAAVAERGACHRPDLEREDRLAQARREALRIRLVGVPLEAGRQLQLVLDPCRPAAIIAANARYG